MALKKKAQAEDAESRALRRMQTFDQSDSDLEQDNSDVSEQEASEEGDDEDESEQDDASERDDDDDDDDEEEEEEEEEEESESDDSESESDSEESDDSDDSGDDDDKKLKELQNNLSQIPFDKLAEIQQKVGMKVFHQTLRGSEKKKVATKGLPRKGQTYDDDDDDSEEDDSDDSEDDDSEDDRKPKNKMDKLRDAMNKEKQQRKIVQKRNDKNKPMEIGSKKPVGRFRQVVEVSNIKRRDPRFDSLSGKLDTDLFEKSYAFIKDYQADEMKKLKELIKKERDGDMKEKLQKQLSRMVDRQAMEAAQKRRQEIRREHKRKERELISKGKNPFFLKKSDQKKLELIDKFQNLKDNPKALARAMEKRRKRNSAKEKTKILGVKRRRTD
ncbi:rRNA biogenesis protein rrp36 [Mortierella sp. AD011]|nr:rRNA biogenesis protein rrp36 [Mortierella sp. AD010]KAF9388864.1 rRNA biogenesis protein rrp36 [Mortierella sp. AD011]